MTRHSKAPPGARTQMAKMAHYSLLSTQIDNARSSTTIATN